MVLDPIPQPLPVHFLGSRPQPPTSRGLCAIHTAWWWGCAFFVKDTGERDEREREKEWGSQCVVNGVVICVAWLIHIRDMTQFCVKQNLLSQGRDSHVTKLSHVTLQNWVMSHSYTWHDSILCVTWLSRPCESRGATGWENENERDVVWEREI